MKRGKLFDRKIAWLRSEAFLTELENDSVDSEIFDEELDLLRAQQPLGCRQKMVKCLQSSPVQIIFCLVVLLDAGIVVSQILLDLHAVKDKVHRREDELRRVLQYIAQIDSLQGGLDIKQIMRLLIQPTAVSNGQASAYLNMTGDTYPYLDDGRNVYHDAAHSLHFASIGVLAILVIEDFITAIAMGREFFRHKTEIVDTIIVSASFIIDILLLRGVHGEEGGKAAVVLVILLLWRITRVADAIMVAVKQRQEFRIRLQKRARRKAEKRVELLEDDRLSKQRQIRSLKELCKKAGVQEEDVQSCIPAPVTPHRVSSTINALSSVAKLSVSMTMSISSGLFSISDDDKVDDHRLKIVMAPGSPQTSSFMAEDDNDSILFIDAVDHQGGSQLSVCSHVPSSPVNVSGVQIVVDDDAGVPSDTDCHHHADYSRLCDIVDTRRSLSVDSTSSADSRQMLLENVV